MLNLVIFSVRFDLQTKQHEDYYVPADDYDIHRLWLLLHTIVINSRGCAEFRNLLHIA